MYSGTASPPAVPAATAASAAPATVRPRMYSPVVLTQLSDQHEQRDEQQVAVAEYQAEGSRPARRAGAGQRDRELLERPRWPWIWYSPVAAGSSAVVKWGGRWVSCRARSRASTTLLITTAKTRSAGGNQQQLRHAHQGNEPAGEHASHHGAEGTPTGDDGEEPLALLLGVQVVGEGPELRHDHQVEDAHPEEEDHPDRDVGPGKPVEGDQTEDEEGGDGVEQRAPRQPVGQGAIGGHQAEEQDACPAAAYDFTSAPSPERISASRSGLMT